MREDEIDALRVCGVEADALGNRLMEKNGLSASPPAKISKFLEQFPSIDSF